jgi:hypothetical protein
MNEYVFQLWRHLAPHQRTSFRRGRRLERRAATSGPQGQPLHDRRNRSTPIVQFIDRRNKVPILTQRQVVLESEPLRQVADLQPYRRCLPPPPAGVMSPHSMRFCHEANLKRRTRKEAVLF